MPLGAANSHTAWRVSRTTRRPTPYIQRHCRYRLADRPPTVRRTPPSNPLLSSHRLAEPLTPPGACDPVLFVFMTTAWRIPAHAGHRISAAGSSGLWSPTQIFFNIIILLAPNANLPNYHSISLPRSSAGH